MAAAQSFPTRPSREQQSPEGFAAFHKAETDKWWPVIEAADIKVE